VATLGGIVVLVANDAGKTANSKFSALNCADVLYPQTPVSPPTPPEGPTPPVAPPPGPDPGGSIGLNTSEPPAQSGVYFGHRSTPPTTLVPAML